MNNLNGLSSLEILFSISRELATTLELHSVLEKVLSLSTANIGAESASLIVLDEKGEPIDAAIIFDGKLTATTIEKMKDVITSGLAGWVIRNKKPALLNDVSKDKRWLARPIANVDTSPGKSALCLPVMAQENLVGVLTIVHPSTSFFTNDLVTLQKAIVDLAGISIYNARLYSDIQTARQRYYDLFEKNIDAIFITDKQGQIIEANQQASVMSGYDNKKLLTLSITALHEVNQGITGSHFELISSLDSLTYESMLQTSNALELPIEVHVSSIMISNESCLQWIFKDIQQQKRSNQLRDDLSAMLFHDLRSPLANIISSLDILSGMLPSEEISPAKAIFDVASRSTERMQRMIDGLLDINRLESGQRITNVKETSLEDVINEAVDVITPAARNREVQIKKVITHSMPNLVIDGEMIRRVITNLLENAIKFSPNQSTVTVRTRKQKDQILVMVDDQGQGIPDAARDDIFEKFVRLKQNYPMKGLGLGLAFCKLAVQAHGGKIWVENIPQGGSRFVFSLPINKEA